MDDFLKAWMWSEACESLARAERLVRQSSGRPRAEPGTVWEPAIDMLETSGQIVIYAAIPGMMIEHVETRVENGILFLSGMRQLPAELSTAVIHRLELPQGRFLRRIVLPAGRYNDVRNAYVDGHLVITVQKVGP